MGSTSSKSNTAAMTEHADFINKEVASSTIVIFSKSYCPYCVQTKQLFSSKYPDTPTAIHELDNINEGSAIQQALAGITGQRTVPNVFIGAQHLGGNDDAQSAERTGKLASMIQKASASKM